MPVFYEVQDYVRELKRVLKKGGKAVIGEYFTAHGTNPKKLAGLDFGSLGFEARQYGVGSGLGEYLDTLGVRRTIKEMILRRWESYFIELISSNENRG